MTTMRTLEGRVFEDEYHESLGTFWTMTEDNLTTMLRKVSFDEVTSIKTCPSYKSVMSTDMRIEVVSLMQVEHVVGYITMSQAEVKALLKHHERQFNEDEVPGSAEPSAFADTVMNEADVEASA